MDDNPSWRSSLGGRGREETVEKEDGATGSGVGRKKEEVEETFSGTGVVKKEVESVEGTKVGMLEDGMKVVGEVTGKGSRLRGSN